MLNSLLNLHKNLKMINEELGYKDQLERLKRAREKLNDYNVNQIIYKDNLWSFFQNAYHLKDWLKNDSNFTLSNKSIEDFITDSKFVKIAADLANRSKHLKLTNERGHNSDCNKESVTIFVNTVSFDNEVNKLMPKPKVIYYYLIENDNNESFNHIDLADNIINEWTELIEKYIL
jgi:hypothetical protein